VALAAIRNAFFLGQTKSLRQIRKNISGFTANMSRCGMRFLPRQAKMLGKGITNDCSMKRAREFEPGKRPTHQVKSLSTR
jgi:hypothetical protein